MPPKRKQPPSDNPKATKKKHATPKPKATAPAAVATPNKAFVNSTIPWPPYFKDLERVHKALNLVYTFCSTRKQLATTYPTLKSAVEGHIKPRELTVSDMAQIRFLVGPRAVCFEYVDEEMLQVYIAGSTNAKARNETFAMKEKSKVSEVLLFEFVDGDLSRSVVKKVKDGVRDEVLKPPTVSTAQMTGLIAKRNKRFESAVNGFLNTCAASSIDPVDALQTQHRPHIPTTVDEAIPAPTSSIPADIPTSAERKPIPAILNEIKASELWCDQIVPDGHKVFPPHAAEYGDLDFVLSQTLVNALYTAHNVAQFYTHQAEAINNLHAGHNVIVSTSTSSGKSLIYQVPVLHSLEQDCSSKALFIFPTKALAQDQNRSLVEVLSYMEDSLGTIRVDTFDGDTPSDQRRTIRDESSVIFTNPDMLHVSILPHATTHWAQFLKHLRFVVVDELHAYTSVFGAHVSLIMRRLRRLCAALGNNGVQFVSCSATISNPTEHMCKVFGLPEEEVRLTDVDGSPSGAKEFLCWNTPYKSPQDPGSGRGDSVAEGARLFAQLILRGVRTICFCRVRNACELMLQAVRTVLQQLGRGDVGERVMAYRGGYTPQDRRRIEKEMFEGVLLGVVATNALELGVDIGSLDAVLILSFPTSLSSLRQQSGRAGRRNADSLSVLIGGTDPIDQHYMSHPSELFSTPDAPLHVDLTNPTVLGGHLQCAAHEIPLSHQKDDVYFGEFETTELVPSAGGTFFSPNPRFLPHPASNVNIRPSADDNKNPNDNYAIIDVTANRNIILEVLEPSRAPFTLYEGGIYLHQGRPYLIISLVHHSTPQRLAKVEAVNVSWTTTPRDFTNVDPVETTLVRNDGCKAYWGKVRVSTKVYGYLKLDKRKHVLDAVELDAAPIVVNTLGVWLDVPINALDILKAKNINTAAAVHAAEHAVLALLRRGGGGGGGTSSSSKSVEGNRAEGLKTECTKSHIAASAATFAASSNPRLTPPKRTRPARLIFYDKPDGGAGGTGGSRRAFEIIRTVLENAVKRVEECRCQSEVDGGHGHGHGHGDGGCAECCAGDRCGGEGVLSRVGALVVLKGLLGWEIDANSIPIRKDKGGDQGEERTVAEEVGGGTEVKIEETGERVLEVRGGGKRWVEEVKVEEVEERSGGELMYNPHSLHRR